jgi:uncharacterized protein YggE
MMEWKNNIVTLFAIAGLIVVALSLTLVKPGMQDRSTMSVSGTSELTISPDKAEAYISIVTEADTAQAAQDQSKGITDKVISALKGMGLKDEDIETSNYYISKKTEWNPKLEKSEEKGYILTQTLKVTTTDISKVGNIVDAAVNAGANGVERISFGLTKETEKTVRAQALTKATEAAKDKGKNMAQAAGVTLGKIVSISESNFYYSPYVANVKNEIAIDNSMRQSIIPPEKVDVSSSVQLLFEIK